MSLVISLLDLAAELGRMHRRSGQGSITVVPVIVDDLSAALPVLQSLCEITDGVFLDTGDPSLQDAVLGTDDQNRRSAVNTSLTSLPVGGKERRVVLTELAGGLLDARFDDSEEGGDLSPGERALLGIARAAVHRDLDTHELGIIVYRDTSIDYPFKRSVWNLAVRQLSGMPNSTLRTLVFVAESSISVALHCQRARGFRLAIDADRLLRRHSDADLTAWTTRIANREAPFVLFLGAGFSVSSRLPLGNEWRDRALRRLLGISDLDPLPSEQLGERFYDWIAEKPDWMTDSEKDMAREQYIAQLTLEQVVRVEGRLFPNLPTLVDFKAVHDRVIDTPGPAVMELAAILRNANKKLILVEVNFDRLIETHSPVPLMIFSSDDEFEHAEAYLDRYLADSETSIPLLKLHGSIDDLQTCVVSEEQTEAGIADGKLRALRALYSDPPRLWIYIGTSMRDRDLLRVFGDADFARGTEEVWVSPYMVSTIEDFARGRWAVWKHRDLHSVDERFISETADVFLAALHSAWPDADPEQ